MAYTLLPLQILAYPGNAPQYTAAVSGGHSIDNTTGRVFLHVKNTNAAARTVTIKYGFCGHGNKYSSLTVTIPATSGDKIIGPFPETFNQICSDTGLRKAIKVDYSATANLTVAAFRLDPSA